MSRAFFCFFVFSVVVIGAGCERDAPATCREAFDAYRRAVAAVPFDVENAAYDDFLARELEGRALDHPRCKGNTVIAQEIQKTRKSTISTEAYVEKGSPSDPPLKHAVSPQAPRPTPSTSATPAATKPPETSSAERFKCEAKCESEANACRQRQPDQPASCQWAEEQCRGRCSN